MEVTLGLQDPSEVAILCSSICFCGKRDCPVRSQRTGERFAKSGFFCPCLPRYVGNNLVGSSFPTVLLRARCPWPPPDYSASYGSQIPAVKNCAIGNSVLPQFVDSAVGV